MTFCVWGVLINCWVAVVQRLVHLSYPAWEEERKGCAKVNTCHETILVLRYARKSKDKYIGFVCAPIVLWERKMKKPWGEGEKRPSWWVVALWSREGCPPTYISTLPLTYKSASRGRGRGVNCCQNASFQKRVPVWFHLLSETFFLPCDIAKIILQIWALGVNTFKEVNIISLRICGTSCILRFSNSGGF